MSYIISIVLSVVSGVLLSIVKNLMDENKKLRKEREDKNAAMKDGVMTLLKIQLIEYHEKYMSSGDIPSYVYENFDEMYTVYETLGGNGMVKHMKESIDKLRVSTGILKRG
jgi:hypothetical protein